MEFEHLSNFGTVGLVITSYEGSDNNPILSHIFWGHDSDLSKSVEQAMKVAISHLKTDLFYSSTLSTGSMMWKDSELKLSYSGKVLSIIPILNESELTESVMNIIEREAMKIHSLQVESFMDKLVNRISNKK